MKPSEPTFVEFETEVLMNATEDVDVLLRAWWIANTLFPERPVSSRLALAERAVRNLLDEHLIILYRGMEARPDRELPSGDYDDVLKQWDTWTAPAFIDGNDLVYFTATKLGRETLSDRRRRGISAKWPAD